MLKSLHRNFFSNFSLQKHAYSNIKKISPPKTENFQIIKLYSRGDSNEYLQSMFLAK